MNIKAELENKRIDMDRLKEEHREHLVKLERDYNDYYNGESNNFKEKEREFQKAKEQLEDEVTKYKNLYSNLMKKSIANDIGVAEKMRGGAVGSETFSKTYTSNINNYKSLSPGLGESPNLFNNINDIKFSELSMNFSQLEREQAELKNMTKNMFSKNNTVKSSALRDKELKEKHMLLTSTFPSNSRDLMNNLGYHSFNDFNKNQTLKNNFFVDANENKNNNIIHQQIEHSTHNPLINSFEAKKFESNTLFY